MSGNGAFTGELSLEMLDELDIHWTLTGHSERRSLYKESDSDVGLKTKRALEHNFNVIACIGEYLEEREAGKTKDVNTRQLNAIREHVDDWSNVVIAYEPVWAIGTGKTATPEIAQETHAEIREWLGKNVSKEAEQQTRILYGGSVTEKNASDLISMEDIDGFLVGGASLKPAFKDIVDACSAHHQ